MAAGMTKTQLVRHMAEKLETNNKTAATFLEHLAETAIKETKKNGVFVIPGLGLRTHAAHCGSSRRSAGCRTRFSRQCRSRTGSTKIPPATDAGTVRRLTLTNSGCRIHNPMPTINTSGNKTRQSGEWV